MEQAPAATMTVAEYLRKRIEREQTCLEVDRRANCKDGVRSWENVIGVRARLICATNTDARINEAQQETLEIGVEIIRQLPMHEQYWPSIRLADYLNTCHG